MLIKKIKSVIKIPRGVPQKKSYFLHPSKVNAHIREKDQVRIADIAKLRRAARNGNRGAAVTLLKDYKIRQWTKEEVKKYIDEGHDVRVLGKGRKVG